MRPGNGKLARQRGEFDLHYAEVLAVNDVTCYNYNDAVAYI